MVQTTLCLYFISDNNNSKYIISIASCDSITYLSKIPRSILQNSNRVFQINGNLYPIFISGIDLYFNLPNVEELQDFWSFEDEITTGPHWGGNVRNTSVTVDFYRKSFKLGIW